MKKSAAIGIILTVFLLVALIFTLWACDPSQNNDRYFTLTLHSGYGDDAVETKTILRSQLSSYCPFSREGYHFAGWSDSADGDPISDDFLLLDAADLYALWELNVYTVRYVMTTENGAQIDLVPPKQAEHGATLQAPDIYDIWQKVRGYKFEGFPDAATMPITEDSVFEAKLSEAQSTVNFYLPERVYPSRLFFSYGGDEGSIVQAPPAMTLTREGFSFEGWAAGNNMFEEGRTKLGYGKTSYDAVWSVCAPAAPPIFKNDELAQSDSFSMEYGGRILLSAAPGEAPADIKYSFLWYEGRISEIPQDDPISGERYMTFSATYVPADGIDFTLVLTATSSDSAHLSFAHTFKTVHIDVQKAKCSFYLSSPGDVKYTRDWTGEPIGFKFYIDGLSSNYTGEKAFEFYLNDEKLSDDRASVTDNRLCEVFVTDGGTFTLRVVLKENEFFKQATATLSVTVRSITATLIGADGSVKATGPRLYSLEEALELKTTVFAQFEQGDSVYLVPKGNLVLKAGERVLKPEFTLMLPYDGIDPTADITAHRQDSVEEFYPRLSQSIAPTHVLTLASGAKLSVQGKILVGGESSNANSTSFQGATQGAYSEIRLLEGSALNLIEGGTLDNYGYITGEGEFTVASGAKLLSPMVVRDFRGGSNMLVTTLHGISPFNQFDLPNILVPHVVFSGAEVYGHMSFYAEGKHIDRNVVLISSAETGNSLVRLFEGSMKITNTASYDSSANSDIADLSRRFVNTTAFELSGKAETGYIHFDASRELIDFSTKALFFAIPHGHSVTIKEGGELTVNSYLKLLPGATFIVEKGASMNIGKQYANAAFAVYGADDWIDSTQAGRHVYPSYFPAARFVVNGELTIYGASTCKIGGEISSSQAGAKVTFVTGAELSLSVPEGNSTSAASVTNMTNVSLEARLSGANSAPLHGSYTFDGERWQRT